MALADLTVGAMTNGSISTRHSIKTYSGRGILDDQGVVINNKQFKFPNEECITAHIQARKDKLKVH